jgi:hypothetical protein
MVCVEAVVCDEGARGTPSQMKVEDGVECGDKGARGTPLPMKVEDVVGGGSGGGRGT